MFLISDLQRHNHLIADEIQTAINRVLERGWYILAPELQASD